ncbi:DUF4158 domain-containing protein [Clostridium sp. SHJSY1]|uniref:DUF4158 domain-containing protein n=1 Tax=Clostridium sp. SHJSY1 TaxID=2942483 RepID=UPI002875247B|nr:DUF4158 domain-containing protein [Clostridium sp. SHJSY1]MDS0527826.1 DUF4158 domain-containing protein [Clostridium sp. SHJSY1]
MPVDFLSHEQELQYGRFTSKPSSEQLAKYFWFDDQDCQIIFQHRHDHNRLGFAIQLGTVRFLGTFLTNPIDVPSNVITYVARQLKIEPQTFLLYTSIKNSQKHKREICTLYGYQDFNNQPSHLRLIRWLYTRAWLTSERPSILFDLMTSRCVEQKILLPGVTVLTKLISQVRERASQHLWSKLSSLPNCNQIEQLENLLKMNKTTKKTGLDTLRYPPQKLTVTGILKAIKRFEEIQAIGALEWDTSGIPISKIRVLSRYASMSRAQSISRMSYDRRIATLVAFSIIYTTQAMDDMLDIFERFITDMFNKSLNKGEKNRIRTIKDLDKAARKLKEVCTTLLNEGK